MDDACACATCASYPSLAQTLDELEHERSSRGRAAAGDLEGLRAALARESPVGDACDASGRTALHYAARAGALACVELVLERSTRAVDARTRSGRATALHKACAGGHAACARALLMAGASAEAVDVDGETALHKACASGSAACVEVVGSAWLGGLDATDARGRRPAERARGGEVEAAIAALEARRRECG